MFLVPQNAGNDIYTLFFLGGGVGWGGGGPTDSLRKLPYCAQSNAHYMHAKSLSPISYKKLAALLTRKIRTSDQLKNKNY